jgi:adenylosuccinate lyase
MAVASRVAAGEPNDLLERLAAELAFARVPVATLRAELDPARYTGRSAAQVAEFLEESLGPAIARAAALAAPATGGEVRV